MSQFITRRCMMRAYASSTYNALQVTVCGADVSARVTLQNRHITIGKTLTLHYQLRKPSPALQLTASCGLCARTMASTALTSARNRSLASCLHLAPIKAR